MKWWVVVLAVQSLAHAIRLDRLRRDVARLEAELDQHIRNRGTHSNVYTGRRTTPNGGTQ